MKKMLVAQSYELLTVGEKDHLSPYFHLCTYKILPETFIQGFPLSDLQKPEGVGKVSVILDTIFREFNSATRI